MKIAHLSDLHISQISRPQNLQLTRRLLEYALEEGVDHIVITGDLTDFSEPHAFIALRNLFDEYNLLNPFKLSLVIGNHDIFGGVHFADDVFKYPNKCSKVPYEKKLSDFKSYFLETFENIYAPPPPEVFPYVKPIGDVLLIGINSIAHYSQLKNYFAAKGAIGKRQLFNIDNLLTIKKNTTRKKIVLMHHHFNQQISSHFEKNQALFKKIERYANRLYHKKQILKLFKKHKVDLILHGHEHVSCKYNIGDICLLNAGGSINKNNMDELKINFIYIYENELITEIRDINFKNVKLKRKKKLFADTIINRNP